MQKLKQRKKKIKRAEDKHFGRGKKVNESTGKHTFPAPNCSSDNQGRERSRQGVTFTVWCKEVKTDTDRCAHMDRTGFQM